MGLNALILISFFCSLFVAEGFAKSSIIDFPIDYCAKFEKNYRKYDWSIITSVSILQTFVDIEKNILQTKDLPNEKLTDLRELMDNLQNHYSAASQPYEHHFLNQYHLIRRFTFDWVNILTNEKDLCQRDNLCRLVNATYGRGLQELTARFQVEENVLQSPDWLIKTILIMIGNQGMYNWSLDTYHTGNTGRIKTVGLSAYEQLEFSIVSTLIKDLMEEEEDFQNTTLYWFHGALLTNNPSFVKELKSFEDIKSSILDIFQQQPKYSRGTIVTLDSITKLLNIVHNYFPKSNLPPQPDEFFEAYCSHTRSDLIPNSENLLCFYQYHQLPYYRFRAEAMIQKLSIILIHDFINDDSMMENLKVSFLEKLVPAQVVTENGSMLCLDRFAKSIALPESHEFSRLMNFNAKQLYGINTAMEDQHFASEPLVLVNYGVQGYFLSHSDYIRNNDFPSQLRVMTLMLYLTDVELGGSTIFPEVGIVSQARKGRALLWHNINEYSEELFCTTHGACPVTIGNKWIITKFITQLKNDHLKICKKYPG